MNDSEAYNYGQEEGYKAGYEKGFNDCEFQQKGAVKAMAKQVEELQKSTGQAELENKVAELQMQVQRAREREEQHRPCTCDLCTPEWRR